MIDLQRQCAIRTYCQVKRWQVVGVWPSASLSWGTYVARGTMGVAGFWDILRPVGKQRSLAHLAVVDGFQENAEGKRGYRVGIDASLWFFHATGLVNPTDDGENPELRMLFFRLARMLQLPLLPLFVFDGPDRPDVKRGRCITRDPHWLTAGMKQIINAYGFEWRDAPGEAEAELAYLNRIRVIDAVISDDIDNFLFGSTVVIRNPSVALSGNGSHPTKISVGVEDNTHVMIYRADDIREELGLTRGGCILVGLLSGGDYHPGGVPGCGPKTAHGLARAGFGDTLFDAFVTRPRDELAVFLEQWRADLREELATNSCGFLGRKCAVLSRRIPESFPDLEVLEKYIVPLTSESLGQIVNTTQMWRREVDVVKIAQCCEQHFDWGYKEMIIKRFRTFLWAGVCMRALRRAVMDSDEKEVDAYRRIQNCQDSDEHDIMATPRKTGRRPHEFAVGTPSGLIQHYFKDMQHVSPRKAGCHFDDEHGDEYGGEGKKLLTRITRSREHGSTDGLLEYRVEAYPIQLVRLAESGIRGTRASPLEADEDEDEGGEEGDEGDEGDEGGDKGDKGEGVSRKKKPKKPPPDPEEPMLLWLPAVMLEMAEPGIVEEFERINNAKPRKTQETEQRKKDRAEGKVVPQQSQAKKADAKTETETEDECSTTPTKRNGPTTSKRNGGRLRTGAIAMAFKVTRKKPVAEGDKGKGKNKFVRSGSDSGDSEEGDDDKLSPEKLFNSIATAAPKPTAKRTIVDELLDAVIGSSPSKSSYRPESFDDADENLFLDSMPGPSAKGKTKPVIVAAPAKPKSYTPPASIQTAHKRTNVLFAQNPDYFSPLPSPGTDEEEEDLDLYPRLTSVPPTSMDRRTISTSTEASGSGSGRLNSAGCAAPVGSVIPKAPAAVEDKVESVEDAVADATPVATSKRSKAGSRAQKSATSTRKRFRFIRPDSPSPEPDPESRALLSCKGREKEKARSGSSRSSTATAEETDKGAEGGVRKRSRKSRAGDSPLARIRTEPPPWLDLVPGKALVPPAETGRRRAPDVIEIIDSDSDGDEASAPVMALVKPALKNKATPKSRKKNTKGVSTDKADIADGRVIDLDM